VSGPAVAAAVVQSIRSRDNPLLQRLRKLGSDPAAYRKLGVVWIEGEHLCAAYVARAAGAERPLQAVIEERAWEDVPALRALASKAANVAVVSPVLMAGVSTLESPPPLGFVVPWHGGGAPRHGVAGVVLDRLQDAGNVGTVLRSAAAFGFGQVIAVKGTAALWSPKVLRAGMGAHFGLHLVEGIAVDALGALGLPMLATSPHAGRALHEVDLPWPCAWVMGHEGQGVSPSLLALCGQSLRIPQPGGEESLNVAAALAVCCYESVRQRAARSP
jgi:RNA methyltransferase, TrmH family